MNCKDCRRRLTQDEIGLTLKLVSRNSAECFCIDCLAKRLRVTVKQLYDVIEDCRENGCMLFAPKDFHTLL